MQMPVPETCTFVIFHPMYAQSMEFQGASAIYAKGLSGDPGLPTCTQAMQADMLLLNKAKSVHLEFEAYVAVDIRNQCA